MTKYTGVENSCLHVTAPVTLSGVAAGGASVEDGGTLQAHGVISGPLLVTKGGAVFASGVISGQVHLHAGASLDLTGVLSGKLVRNDGDFTAAVGSVIRGKKVSAQGTFEDPTSEPVFITPETQRFRLQGTGAKLSLG